MPTPLPDAPLRPVTDAEVDAFWRDGVVCLRGVMPEEWLEAMADPVEDALGGSSTADLTGMGEALAEAGDRDGTVDEAVRTPVRGRFRAGTDHWLELPAFADFALRSPLGPIVARLLRTEKVHLYEDSLLVKEPGTREATAFHQDMAYFHLTGDQVCTTWVPLDPVTAESGAVRFVVGSHLDRTPYRPNLFVTTTSIPGTAGVEVPDEAHLVSGGARIVSFDTEPGDVTVHHARTIHGAYANASATRRRRAISVRYAGDDARFAVTPGAPTKGHHGSLHDGDELTDVCPLAWPAGERA
ncbi:MAG: phytanoyl-CoA dioxygenase family protein [Acidimicrobiales bacterium]|jgi:ectoine hydroxylase-related dioxygenase (phytanoyl-CoA dioxygenase family)|nr:phytanoyl-CoA dioxygenase family protein [Acidimicrobiales bacterium]